MILSECHESPAVVLLFIPFRSIYRARAFIPRKNCPNVNMNWNGIDPNNNLGTQRFSHLDRPTKYQYLTGITILIPVDRIFDTIIDVDS